MFNRIIMSKTNTFENSFLKLIFNNVSIANIGDATGIVKSSTDGFLYVSLWIIANTEGVGGTEATYTNYARKKIARTTGGWTVVDNQAVNAVDIVLPTSGSSQDLVGVGIHTALTGGDDLYYQDLPSTLSVVNGSEPTIIAGQAKFNED